MKKNAGAAAFFIPGAGFSANVARMSILVPVLVIGTMIGAVWAAESPPVPKMHDAPVTVPVTASHAATGMGAYLRGAVADVGGDPEDALKGYLEALNEDPDNMELRARAFELALLSGDVDNAIRLGKALPRDEQTTMSRLVRMADAARKGDVQAALIQARHLQKVSPDLLQFQILVAYLEYADGKDVAGIVKDLDKLKVPGPLVGRRDYHEARLWLKSGDYAKALPLLEKAHVAEPGSVASTLLLGQVLVHQGQPDKAAAVYDAFRARNPALSLLVPSGKVLMDAQDVPVFASTLDEDLASDLLDFGILVWAQGVIVPAREVLNISLWLDPNDVYARYYTGMLLEMGGDLDAASQDYALLVEGDNVPELVRVAAKMRLAEVMFARGDQDAAWHDMRALVKRYPDLETLRRSYAQMAFNRGEYRIALENYSRLLKELPDDSPTPARVELLFARGASYERSGNKEAASRDLQMALTLDPTNADILNYLGYMWVEQGVHIAEAFKLLQRAHLLAPTSGAITDSLGWAYYRQGDAKTALAYLNRAVEQSPDSAEILDHLGDVYAKLGRHEDAKTQWRKALDIVNSGGDAPDKDFKEQLQRKLH